jgi:CRISPR-associated exonuclease Cas4
MERSEDELLPISALQHLLYCERQCALIHLEGIWEENLWTVEGHILHNKVHGTESELREDRYLTRGIHLHNFALGLYGVSDMVEFECVSCNGIKLEGMRGIWKPIPVEYKSGKKRRDCDEVQLCAQALCLEEMLSVSVPKGMLYYGKAHRRVSIVIDDALREKTRVTVEQLRMLFNRGNTPVSVRDERCVHCSLKKVCLPILRRQHVLKYFEHEVDRALDEFQDNADEIT